MLLLASQWPGLRDGGWQVWIGSLESRGGKESQERPRRPVGMSGVGWWGLLPICLTQLWEVEVCWWVVSAPLPFLHRTHGLPRLCM